MKANNYNFPARGASPHRTPSLQNKPLTFPPVFPSSKSLLTTTLSPKATKVLALKKSQDSPGAAAPECQRGWRCGGGRNISCTSPWPDQLLQFPRDPHNPKGAAEGPGAIPMGLHVSQRRRELLSVEEKCCAKRLFSLLPRLAGRLRDEKQPEKKRFHLILKGICEKGSAPTAVEEEIILGPTDLHAAPPLSQPLTPTHSTSSAELS